MMARYRFGDLLVHEIGGGWGSDEPSDESPEAAFVIRGTDIPKALVGDISSVPLRYHKGTALLSRLLRNDDIVFEVSGGSKGQPVGRALLINDRLLHQLPGGAICASFCKLIRLDASLCNPRYVYRLLQRAYRDGTVETFQVQSTGITNFKWKPFIDRFMVDLPDPRTQHRVAEVLDAFDELIENNRRRIDLLEQMAQEIYREWFVRFRYPGHKDDTLADSRLGPIPEGWDVRHLFEMADVGFGFSFKSKCFASSGPYPVVRIRDVPAGTTKTYTDEVPPERFRVVDSDVLIGMDGDFHLRQWTGGEAWLNQRVARLRPLGNLSARQLMLAIEGPIKEWNLAIIGTTVAHLGKRHLEQIHILVPPSHVLTVASAVFADVASQERALVQAGRQLAAIRDLLLPKLVTGQIDVSTLDLDAVVGLVA
jgi:type I restriction enzyme S subunit